MLCLYGYRPRTIRTWTFFARTDARAAPNSQPQARRPRRSHLVTPRTFCYFFDPYISQVQGWDERRAAIMARGDHARRWIDRARDRRMARRSTGAADGSEQYVLAPPGPRPRPAASSAQRRLAVRIDHTRWGRRAHWLLRASPNGVS